MGKCRLSICFGLYATLYFWHVLPKGRLVIPFIFFGSIIIESIGVHTGWPFGTYRYESDFGVQLLGVPITIGADGFLSWARASPSLVCSRFVIVR
ncbi:carotenoid biosynthesis protein [Exiguobacterium sp. SL14]|nr:carotenoid biosynthesis protein [Exiguobacterium sp. SL14]MCY1692014.1 carotenoid biosynthesis protein [Exiguobacterium sp. SL14]